MVIDFSIIICTYNPDQRLLSRCLNAVANLDISNLSIEVLLIDNNSTIPLSDLSYVQDFLQAIRNARIIHESAQGLTSARTAGIKAAAGHFIVFFDDDNEADSNYLQELVRLTHYSNVAAWGPGNISVDFIDGIDSKLERHARPIFQERQASQVEYAYTLAWQYCYPFGTGMCVRSDLLKMYAQQVESGYFTLSDRRGKSLSSGGDVQIIYTCLKHGWAAGVSPGLMLTHIIPGKRSNGVYIRRLLYGCGLGAELSRLEVFPEYREQLVQSFITERKFVRRVIRKYLRLLLTNNEARYFAFATYVSTLSGAYIALNREVPKIVRRIVKALQLD